MSLTAEQQTFVEEHYTSVMITVGDDGRPKAARISHAVIDGRICASCTAGRVRTNRLRRDPRCTLYVHAPQSNWLALETNVTILEGPDTPALNLRIMRAIQSRPEGPVHWRGRRLDAAEFMAAMVEEDRLVFEFEVLKAYGLAVGTSQPPVADLSTT